MSVGCNRIGLEMVSPGLDAIYQCCCAAPPEKEQVMLETCRGPIIKGLYMLRALLIYE
jgi:hypothetical protein